MTAECILCHQGCDPGELHCRQCRADTSRIDAAGRIHADGPKVTAAAAAFAPEARRITEVEIERRIMRRLERAGWNVTKTSIRAHPKGATPGTPDLYASHPVLKRVVWIEVKTEDGVVSHAQMEWHEKQRAAGVEVIIAWREEDVLELASEAA